MCTVGIGVVGLSVIVVGVVGAVVNN